MPGSSQHLPALSLSQTPRKYPVGKVLTYTVCKTAPHTEVSILASWEARLLPISLQLAGWGLPGASQVPAASKVPPAPPTRPVQPEL